MIRRVPSGRTLVVAWPYLWLLLFFLVPLAIVLRIALSEAVIARPPYAALFARDGDGALAIQLNLQNFLFLVRDDLYWRAYLNSAKIALIATALCLLLGYPVAYGIARAAPALRNVLLMLVILPFWTSFLLRVDAWIGLLKNNGLINHVLVGLGIIDQPLVMMQTDFAVHLGIVYSYLPFMILPLYAKLQRLDHTLREAAADLGCRPHKVFLTITLPLSLPGVVAGSMLVFIPAVGEFVIPALLGGPAHVTFSMAYVAVVIQSQLANLDPSLEEAALDLGARPAKVFCVITLPLIAPALVSGWLLSFTLSLDDLIIASFVSGPGSSTLPMVVFSKVRLGVSPEINALATLFVLVVSIGVIAAGVVTSRAQRQRTRDARRRFDTRSG